MPQILTAEDVIKRIAAECAFVDERGAVGIRLKPAAAIVRLYGEQFRLRRRKPVHRAPKPPPRCNWLQPRRRMRSISPTATP